MKFNSVKLIVIFTAVLWNCIYSQIPDDLFSRHKYNITHSIGAGFKEHELTFYLSVSRLVSKDFSFGLKGGIYDYSENTVDKIIDTFIAPMYSQLNPGHYTIQIDKMTVQGNTYIGSFYCGYRGLSDIIISAGVGFKYYMQSNYSLSLEFDKAKANSPAPKPSDLYTDELEPYEVNRFFKPYFSLGFDYALGLINLGVYADNIYSAGINIGVSF
jgi:hypothetical protein